jgi:hypothetical protein
LTAYNKTVANNLWPFSNAASNISLWGTELWGTGYWGFEPTKPAFTMNHFMVANGPTFTSANGSRSLTHYMVANGPTFTSANSQKNPTHVMSVGGPAFTSANSQKNPGKVISETVSPTSANLSFSMIHYMAADGPALTSANSSRSLTHYMVADGLALTSANAAIDFVHYMVSDSFQITSDTIKLMDISVSESFTVAGNNSSETLQDDRGFFLVEGSTSNFESRSLSVYTEPSEGDAPWTDGSDAGTTWGDV